MTALSTVSPWSRDSNMSGRPRAKINTPSICTIVASRKTQSSVS
jgi:hypothetical protein